MCDRPVGTGQPIIVRRAVDAQLDDAVLDRIDEIVPPGTTLNPTDAGWTNPALAPAERRR